MFTNIFIFIVSTLDMVNSAVKIKTEQSIIFKINGNLVSSCCWEMVPNVSTLIIDLKFMHFVEAVSITIEETDTADLNVSVRHMDEGSNKICPKKAGNYFQCDAFSKYVQILSSVKVNSTDIYGYATDFENYLGCFKLLIHRNSIVVNTSTICGKKCYLSWYGLTEDFKCICFPTLRMLKPANLSQCNKQCGNHRLQFCGAEEYFAVYSTKKEPIWQQEEPSLSCLFDQTDCPKCSNGRSGERCDVIDCSINNGNCETTCAKVTEELDFEYSRCTCKEGFIIGDNLTCSDYNECNEIMCPADLQCINNIGSYLCHCKGGYTHDDNNACIDIDECLTANICDLDTAECNNLPGYYECRCLPGYTRKPPFKNESCQDLNECRNKPCASFRGKCFNKIGSYTCQCTEGFNSVNDTLCEDIDECLTQKICDKSSTYCVNTPGDFECVCYPGLVKITIGNLGACEEHVTYESEDTSINDFNIGIALVYSMFYIFAIFGVGLIIYFYRKFTKVDTSGDIL